MIRTVPVVMPGLQPTPVMVRLFWSWMIVSSNSVFPWMNFGGSTPWFLKKSSFCVLSFCKSISFFDAAMSKMSSFERKKISFCSLMSFCSWNRLPYSKKSRRCLRC